MIGRGPIARAIAALILAPLIVVVGACGGSSDDAGDPTPASADESTASLDDDAGAGADDEAAVATAAPTPTVEAPTPTPAPTLEPTPTPDPVAAVRDDVVAGWVRYLELSVAARGLDPGPEALAFDTYVASEARTALERSIADGLARGEYVTGTITSTAPTVEIRDDGAAILSDCLSVNLEVRSAEHGDVVRSEQRERAARARLELTNDRWIAFAVEAGDACADE